MEGWVVFDVDGVIRDVSQSYRRAIADTVEHCTQGTYRPTPTDIDRLKAEGRWNNDWEATRELIHRAQIAQGRPAAVDFDLLVAFFQERYWGCDPGEPTGYITQETLLVERAYFAALTAAGLGWGFFTGAPRREACLALVERLGLANPVVVAMEDAPAKPDPTGLLTVVQTLETQADVTGRPVAYVGDTVADMLTIQNAQQREPGRTWVGVGVLPPHVCTDATTRTTYSQALYRAGAQVVFPSLAQVSAEALRQVQTCLT
ncbi:MAG: TIGR01548 family HAD-type hydrolase [Gloeomargaritaceae cyanobacterium C42_A2020_066]|nr:TIGR01548 family HAD-type hydrolase [Gloeomargaritaceae cyanobacterium C42_A2020_066]